MLGPEGPEHVSLSITECKGLHLKLAPVIQKLQGSFNLSALLTHPQGEHPLKPPQGEIQSVFQLQALWLADTGRAMDI